MYSIAGYATTQKCLTGAFFRIFRPAPQEGISEFESEKYFWIGLRYMKNTNMSISSSGARMNPVGGASVLGEHPARRLSLATDGLYPASPRTGGVAASSFLSLWTSAASRALYNAKTFRSLAVFSVT